MKAPSRRRHHKAEKLSDVAARLVEDGLAGNASYDAIVEKVLASTGEKISTASIGRYNRAKVEPRREAQRTAAEMARQMTEFLKGSSADEVSAAIEARMAQQVFPIAEALASEKPEHAAYFYSELVRRRLEGQKLSQRQAELELRAEQLKLAKEAQDAKLAEIRRRAEAALAPGQSKKVTKEELLDKIRDLYGLARETPNSAPEARETGGSR